MKATLNIQEIQNIVNYIIENNKKLLAEGNKPSAIEIIGESGIGKTSVILQIAKENNMDCVKINLAQMEELGDLIGYPLKEYEVIKDGKCRWVAKDILPAIVKTGVEVTGKHRMSYATPEWLPEDTNPNGGVLVLDDWNRADPRFLTAVMELIDRGEFLSWKMPANWTIMLTANPDNGDYNVSSLDNAQKTRYISFDMEFNVNTWAQWAEGAGIDSRGINFVLSYPEIMDKQGGIQKINARSLVNFFNAISGFKDFSNKESLGMILNIASGAFTTDDNTVGNLFTMFIANKLDKLITPEEMLTKKWATLRNEIEACVYDKGVYRPDIASVLTTRLLNYSCMILDKKGSKIEPIIGRIMEFVNDNGTMLLSEDLIFNLLKTLASKYPTRVRKLITNPSIAARILC